VRPPSSAPSAGSEASDVLAVDACWDRCCIDQAERQFNRDRTPLQVEPGVDPSFELRDLAVVLQPE
jgi:hypothetical protein